MLILEALGRAPRGATPSQSGLRAGVVILENNLLTNYVLCELCFGYELGLCPFGLFWSTVLGLCPFGLFWSSVLGLCPFGLLGVLILGYVIRELSFVSCPLVLCFGYVLFWGAVLGCYVLWGLFLVVGDDVGVQF